MKLRLYENTFPDIRTKREINPHLVGELCAHVTIDMEYQAEEWVKEIEQSYPQVILIECFELNRTWKRNQEGKFAE